MTKYTVDYHDDLMTYCVIEWKPLSNSVSSGRVVYRDDIMENAYAMCEEYQYSAECHEWALFNNQESEFDYV